MDPNNMNPAAQQEFDAMRGAMLQFQADAANEANHRQTLLERVEGLMRDAAVNKARTEEAMRAAQAAHAAAAAAVEADPRRDDRPPNRAIPKIDLMTYDGTGDLDQWQKRCRGVFAILKTPLAMRATIAFLTALRGVVPCLTVNCGANTSHPTSGIPVTKVPKTW